MAPHSEEARQTHPVDIGVGASEVEGFGYAVSGDDQHGDLAAAQLRQIVCFFEETALPLAEGDLQSAP